MNRLGKNVVYQVLYQLLAVVLPLVTSPHLSRTLGVAGLGIYSYSHSIVSYFLLFAMMGTGTYGTRRIAQSDGSGEVSQTFCEVYSCQLSFSLISVIAYVVLCCLFWQEHFLVQMLQVLFILAEFVNVNWLFFGLEKYKLTVIRNLVIKISTFALILLLVRDSDDLVVYTAIMAGGSFISNFLLWVTLPKYVKRTKISVSSVVRHIKPCIILFIPVLAASVYHVMDKTMLGMYSDEINSGYYYAADKLVNIPLTIITACCNVFMTRIAALMGRGKDHEARAIQDDAICFGMWAVCAIAFGVAGVAEQFVPFFFGTGYEPCIELVRIFALTIVARMIATHTRTAFLLPEKKDKVYTLAIVTGAILNLAANYVLICHFGLGAYGATVGTLIAEISVCVVQIVCMGRCASRKRCVMGVLRNSVYAVCGLLMYSVIVRIDLFPNNLLASVIVKVLMGAMIYLTACAVLWRTKKYSMPILLRSMMSDLLGIFKKNKESC